MERAWERAKKAKVSSMGCTVQCELVHFYKAKKYKKDVPPGQVWKCHIVNDSYINLTQQTLVYFELKYRKVIPLV